MDPHQPPATSQNLSSEVSSLSIDKVEDEDLESVNMASPPVFAPSMNKSTSGYERVSSSRQEKTQDFLSTLLKSNSNSNPNNVCVANDNKSATKLPSVEHMQPFTDYDNYKENVNSFEDIENFYHALMESHLNGVEDCLFKSCVDVNVVFTSDCIIVKRKHFGWRAIHIAASKGNAKVIKFLLQQGADLNLLTHDGDTALHIAAKNGCADIIKLILEHDIFLRDCPNSQGITALLKAVFNSQHAFKGSYHQCVNLLLGAGCNPNISSSSLVTALHVAVDNGDLPLVHRLIHAGANVNAICDRGSSPLLRAVISKHINRDIITALLHAHADPNIKLNGRSLLHIAVSRCDDRLVEAFVKFGADLNFIDSSGKTPLLVAVEENNIKVVPILISAGADINFVKHPRRLSILYQAVLNNSFPMVKLLLDHGASPHIESIMWSTPLHTAVDNQNVSIIQELLRSNCPLNIYSNAKFAFKPLTPFQLAMESANAEIINLLLRCGARVNLGWLKQDRIPFSLSTKPELVMGIQKHFHKVPSLLHLSRVCVREFLGENFKPAVSFMRTNAIVPGKLVDYLHLTDILDCHILDCNNPV